MKKMKNRKGFTLVELIVVIAILAILAAVAIPVYSNYIKKANEAADYTMLDAVKTAAVFEATSQGAKLATPEAPVIKTITVNEAAAGAASVTVTYNGTTTVSTTLNISEYYPDAIEFKSGVSSATWNGTAWTLGGSGS